MRRSESANVEDVAMPHKCRPALEVPCGDIWRRIAMKGAWAYCHHKQRKMIRKALGKSVGAGAQMLTNKSWEVEHSSLLADDGRSRMIKLVGE